MAGVYADSSLRRQHWLSYVEVGDLGHAISRATRRGAAIIAGPKAVPGGRMAQLRDPEGALLGLRETSGSNAR
jgi:predicted enzyme related to lactoylglutathione lyase